MDQFARVSRSQSRSQRLSPCVLAVTCLAANLAACAGKGERTPSTTDAVTFYEDVAPIINAECVGCHHDGGIAPFSLVDYPSVKAHAAAIVAATSTRDMPPMPVNGSGSCNIYSNARWLTDAQLETLASWAAHGTQQGDPHRAPSPPAPLAGLDAPDAVVDVGISYTPNGALPDDYRCFVAAAPVSQATFLAGFEVVPGDARVVHHVIAYQPNDDPAAVAAHALDDAEAGPGYTCFGGPGVDAAPIALWAPGTGAVMLPTGTGVALAANRPWVVQIHYNLAQGVFSDRTRVKLRLTNSSVQPAVFAPVADLDLRLPPGRPSVETSAVGTQDPTTGYTVYGAGPHMHTLGRTMRVDVTDGIGPTCLDDVDRWDFHWQNLWWYQQPIHVTSPRSISIRCGYDTTSKTETVTWGEGTADEMCISYFYLVPDAPPPAPTCDGAGNPLFGSCIDGFFAGCYQPDRTGTCSDTGGVVNWSDGAKYVKPTQAPTDAPGFYRAGETAPCVGLATNASGSTLTKGNATIRYTPAANAATINCPDGSTFTASSAQITAFNRCRGVDCPAAGR